MIDRPIDRLEAWLARGAPLNETVRADDVRAVLNMLNDATGKLDKLNALLSLYRQRERERMP